MYKKEKKPKDRSVRRRWMQEIDNQSTKGSPKIDQTKSQETDRQKWYRARIKEGSARCAECGNRLNYNNEEVAFGSQAHLLPKELFPSVALHPQNCIELGRWCCHGQYDSSWLNASRMKIWPYAVDIIVTVLVPLLTQKEKAKLPDIISTLAEP